MFLEELELQSGVQALFDECLAILQGEIQIPYG